MDKTVATQHTTELNKVDLSTFLAEHFVSHLNWAGT